MDLSLYLTFVTAVTILMLIPGPNVALIVANSVAYGPRFGLLTVAGTSAAMILQLSVTAAGMTSLLAVLAQWFEWLRWAGVAYLVYLGVRQWRMPATDLAAVQAQPKSKREIFLRGFLVSLTNPKTLLFYGAFFPQFISPAKNATLQIAILALTFLALAILLDGTWALLAGRARSLLSRNRRAQNRLTGGLLIGAGVGLALARKE